MAVPAVKSCCKNDITQWWFEGGDKYSILDLDSFPPNFIENGDGVNTSRFLSTGETTLTGNKKVNLIRNLPITYTGSTITHEIRLKNLIMAHCGIIYVIVSLMGIILPQVARELPKYQ